MKYMICQSYFDTSKSKALIIFLDCIKGSIGLFVMLKSHKNS